MIMPKMTPKLTAMLPYVEGWFSMAEAQLLFDTVVDSKAKVVVELGAFHGRSTLVLSEAVLQTGGRVTSCDAWPEEFTSMEHYLSNLRRGTAMTRVDPVRGDFARAARMFDDNSVDLLFFDGRHDKNDDTRVLAAWLEKVKIGGWFLSHDYVNAMYPCVAEVVDSNGWRFDPKTKVLVDSLVGWRKIR